MTTEERLTAVEDTQAMIVDLIERVVEMTRETQEMTRETQALSRENQRRIEVNEQILNEVRRESQQTRRIWIAFARHHGWPEDLDDVEE